MASHFPPPPSDTLEGGFVQESGDGATARVCSVPDHCTSIYASFASMAEFASGGALLGGTVLILDGPPPGSEVGVDYKAWQIGERFKGVYGIPPGVHMVYYSCSDVKRGVGLSSRTCFFLQLEPGDVQVFRWDTSTELLQPVVDEDDAQRYSNMVRGGAFSDGLGPYDTTELEKWTRLSHHISPTVLDRLEPVHKCIHSTAKWYDSKGEAPTTIPTVFYTPMPDRRKRKGKTKAVPTPREITAYALDRSQALVALIRDQFAGDMFLFLGEMQFSFLCFLLGQSLEAFDQWKAMVALVCTAESLLLGTWCSGGNPGDAAKTEPAALTSFTASIMPVLLGQLKEMPRDFFHADLTKGNFLRDSLRNLFSILTPLPSAMETPVNTGLVRVTKELFSFVEDELGYTLDECEDDDGPAIVDLQATRF